MLAMLVLLLTVDVQWLVVVIVEVWSGEDHYGCANNGDIIPNPQTWV